MNKQQQFIEAIAPHAQEVQKKYGVPASIVIAQAALESGWDLTPKGNNLFGIKANSSWQGAKIEMATHEYLKGARVNIKDSFRSYTTFKDSIENYGQFLASNRRYAGVLKADDAHAAADALQRAGYATDPKYAEKLKTIISANDLTRFDDASYKGYSADTTRFQNTRQRLQQQREEKPEVWDGFMKNFFELLASIFSGIFAALGFGDDKPTGAPQTPTKTASTKTPAPARG